MTGKQRAYLRKLANTIDAKYQIGKDGISEETVKMIDLALEANELIKIKILENAFLGTREVSDELCEATGAFPVQCIGNKLVLYRESVNNKTIVIPKK